MSTYLGMGDLLPGSGAIIATHDTGPTGALRLHSAPDVNSSAVGSAPHGAVVSVNRGPVDGPGSPSEFGWYNVTFQGLTGWASAEFMQPEDGLPPIVIPNAPSSPNAPNAPSSDDTIFGLPKLAVIGGGVIAAGLLAWFAFSNES